MTFSTHASLWLFRVVVLAHAAAMALMPYFAGAFLEGAYPALAVHAALGGALMAIALVGLVAAVLLRWPGRLPLWPAGALLAILLLTGVQLGLGYGRALAWHLPLGVLLVASSVALAVWAWTPGRAARSARGQV